MSNNGANGQAATSPVSVGVVFGETKRLKTSCLLAAFPNALYIGAAPAISLVAENEYGFSPTIWPWRLSPTETSADYYSLPSRVETLPDLYEVLQMIDEEGYATEFGAVVNDDLTPICKRSVRAWKLEGRVTKGGSEDFYYPYQQLDGFMVDVAGLSRHMGGHCWSTAWERSSSYNPQKRKTYPGGPDVGSAEQSERLPGWFDTNVRALVDSDYPDMWMRGCLFADVRSSEWKTGDRNGVAINGRRVPPNVRELLRAARTPYVLARLDGCQWQDELAEEVAQAVVAYGSRSREVWGVVAGVFGGEVPESPQTSDGLRLRWACQDGVARGVLRRMLASAVVSPETFLAGGTAAGGRPRPRPRPQG